MQVGKPSNHIPIDLEMTLLHHFFPTHHLYQVLVPLSQLFLLFSRITGHQILADTFQVASVGTNHIFYLPHINQVFGNVLLLQLSGNKH